MKKLFTLLAICAMAVTSASADVTLSASTATCKVGEAVTFTASGLDSHLSDLVLYDITTESEKELASVDLLFQGFPSSYSFTNIKFDATGTYKILANQGGVYSSNTVTVTVTPAATAVTLHETDEVYPEAAVWDESKTYDITLNRTMKANQWNTLMLSFPMTAAEVKSNFGSDVTVMKMTGIADNVVNFETVDLATDAATAFDVCEAYIVKPTAAKTQIKVTGKTGLKNEIFEEDDYYLLLLAGEDYQLNCADRIFADWDVRSCFCSYTEDGSRWPAYVLKNDKFYSVDSEVEVKGYRWVIADVSGVKARALTLSLDGVIDETTGINNVDASTGSAQAQTNGKFVENGRVVIVKNNQKFNAAGQIVR